MQDVGIRKRLVCACFSHFLILFFFSFSRSSFIINSNKDCERKWTKIKVSIKTQHNCTLRSCDDLFLRLSCVFFSFRKINTQAQLNSLNAANASRKHTHTYTRTHHHHHLLLRKRAAWRHSRSEHESRTGKKKRTQKEWEKKKFEYEKIYRMKCVLQTYARECVWCTEMREQKMN